MGKIPSSGRIGDFVDHRNGTVTDIRTGLMWMRCAQGQTWNGKTCVGKVQGYAWDEAMALRHDFAGYDDWRLPDIDELKSIIDKTRGRPAIDTAAFPNAPGLAFWSASVYDGNSDSAWVALFSNGNGYSFRKTGSLQVRLVRGEQALGTLNGGATSQATGFPVKEAPAVIQVETHKDAVTNIIDSPIRAGSSGNFVARSDGTATDTRTGLMWMRCALGQTWDGTTCVGKVQGYTWDEAMALRHSFSGHDDWRLPDIDELKSIIDKTRGRPAIDTAAFPNAPSLFSWSASVYAGDSNAAWGVDFLYGGGSSNYKSGNGLVRLVRGGKALGTLNGEAISQAIGFPVKETPVAIQVEAHKDASTSIIDSSICEEASGNFIAHSDGTVTDTRTGLMWMRCALGQTWDGTTCVGKVQGYTWDEAMALRHSFSGHDDWRLPDIDELKSIIDKTRGRPAIDTAVFPNTPGRVFWSISTYVGDSDYAWSVSFYSGNDDYHYKVDCYYVRLVRGGQASVTLNCDAIDKANRSPVEEAPVAIQAETRRDASINVIDSPLREKAPDNFVVHADGTVTDTRTGLIWMRCALGQTWDGTTCVGKVQGCTWDEAMALRHSFVGHDDWRLPDIDELKSIIDKTRGRPAIDTAVFPNATSSYFWSGSPSDFCSGHAWYVYFGNGLVDDDDHSNDYGVRFVRGGQVETHEDASTNIIDSSIREEVSGNFVIQSETHKDASINAVDSPREISGDFANNGEAQTTESISEITTVIERLQLLEEKLSGSIARVERIGDGQASAKSIVHAAIESIRRQPELFAPEIAELRELLGEAGISSTSEPVDSGYGGGREVESAKASPANELVATNQHITTVSETLKQVIAWLMTQETVALSDLRAHLLPLDLLPSAVINDLNEQALDITGDPAIEEHGDKITIFREVLAQIDHSEKRWVRHTYDWNGLVNPGDSFSVPFEKVGTIRQLVFARNKKESSLGTNKRYKCDKDKVVLL